MIFLAFLAAADLFLLGVVLANALLWGKPRPGREVRPGSVSVLIPARDEEENLPPCLAAVLAQGPPLLEVLVYDDGSADGTAAVVAGLAERDSRLRLLPGLPLPAGWTGKSHACWRLGQQGRGEWLLFLDADARLAPGALAAIAGEAAARSLTFLSCWPGLVLGGFAEKLLMPLLNFFVLSLYPAFLAPLRREPALGLAHGACLLVQREAYRRLGGHQLVAGEVFEDTALARAWRRHGERSLCLDGREVVRVRMYRSFAEIWRGFQKNFYPGFRREGSFWAFLALHALLFLAPFLLAPLLAAVGSREAALLAGIAAAAVLAQRLALALRFGQPLWSPFLHPLAEGVLLALGLASRRRARKGGGVEWKGRRYGAGGG